MLSKTKNIITIQKPTFSQYGFFLYSQVWNKRVDGIFAQKNKINKIGGIFFVKIFKTSGAPLNSSFYEVLKRVEV